MFYGDRSHFDHLEEFDALIIKFFSNSEYCCIKALVFLFANYFTEYGIYSKTELVEDSLELQTIVVQN